MNCKRPYLKGIEPFPCGQCLPCRINRRRLWTHRILLESKCHDQNVFCTLTLSPDNYPADGSLDPVLVRNWLKRVRRAFQPRHLRFFAVGEYGDQTGRAHYHAVLFGVGTDSGGMLEKCWSLGHVDVRSLSPELAQYIAGYTVKKLTKPDDPALGGRYPEFARMSLRPGIGGLAVGHLSDVLTSEHGSKLVAGQQDVPAVLRHGSKLLPLGRYLRQKIRDEVGFDETTGASSPFREAKKAELQALLDSESSRFSYLVNRPFVDHQKVRQIEGKAAIYAKRSKL